MWKRLTHSLQFRFVLLVVCIMIVLVTFSVVFFLHTFNNYLVDSSYEGLEVLVAQTNETLEGSFSMIENTMEYFFYNQTLRKWIARSEVLTPDDSGRLTSEVALDNALKHSIMINSAWQNDLMDAAFFFVDDKSFSLYARGKFSLQTLTQRNFRVFEHMYNTNSDAIQIFPPAAYEPVFYLGKQYQGLQGEGTSLHLIISVDEDTLCQKYSSVLHYPDAEAYIMDRDGVIFSTTDKSQLGMKAQGAALTFLTSSMGELIEVTHEGISYYAITQKVANPDLYFVVGIPKESLLAVTEDITSHYILAMLAFFAVFLLVGIMTVLRSTSVLRNIARNLAKIKAGKYHTRMPKYKITEFVDVSKTFNEMAARIDHLVNEVYEKQLAVKQADIKYLQSQINPHFLFNTFAAIGIKAKLAHQESIYNMITAVSTLLQASFKFDDEQPIPLEDELEYINCYLYIQKERFGERLEYRLHVEREELRKALIPRLCVEPIVENAVIHGLEIHRGVGRVDVTVTQEGDTVVVSITDNGVGFPPDVRSLEDLANGKRDGTFIGLCNTHKRLQLIYGEKYGVFIDADRGKGAKVIVRLPFVRED